MDVSASKMAKLLNQTNSLLQVFQHSVNAAPRKGLAMQTVTSEVLLAENS